MDGEIIKDWKTYREEKGNEENIWSTKLKSREEVQGCIQNKTDQKQKLDYLKEVGETWEYKLKRSPDKRDQILTEKYCFYVKMNKGCYAYTEPWRQAFLQVIKFKKTGTFKIFPPNTDLSLLTKER